MTKTTIKATLQALEPLPNTRNGNPRYRAVFVKPDGSVTLAQTAPDSMLAYSLPNHQGQMLEISLKVFRGYSRILSISVSK